MKVISRSSVMSYRNTAGRNLREIGQQLGVVHVLEGSVRRAPDRGRIVADIAPRDMTVAELTEFLIGLQGAH